MQHTISRHGATTVIALSGELDMSVSADLTRVLTDEVNRPGAGAVRADLAAVDFDDSTVISTLVGAYRTAQRTGRTFTVVGARGHVGKVLGVAGVLPALTSPPG